MSLIILKAVLLKAVQIEVLFSYSEAEAQPAETAPVLLSCDLTGLGMMSM